MTKYRRDYIRPTLADQADLQWYFSYGITTISRSTAGGILDTLRLGVLGNGCSVHLAHEPNEFDMVKAGEVCAVLAKITDTYVKVLALAYGDAGFVATDGGRLPERRWRCVAHLTKTAVAQGDKHRKALDSGDAARLWLERSWARGAKVTKEINRAEKEARALIDAAEIAYAMAAQPKRMADIARKNQVENACIDRQIGECT